VQITREQIGIILVIIGTLLLAFSVQVKRQYGNEARKAVDNAKLKDPGLFEPTESYIIRSMFWFGLLFIAVGSAFQW
jgi:dipeptide/tripeptide permease